MLMINQINKQIILWIKDIVSDVDVVFCAPKDSEKNEQISVYLSSIEKMMGNTSPAFSQIKLKYLITITSASDERTHGIISRLLESGNEHPVFSMLPESLPVDYWLALKVIPQPVFSLTYLLDISRHRREAPLVEKEPNIVTTPMSLVYGVVLGEKNKPVSRCRLELKSCKRSVLTDHQGRFDLGQISSASASIITLYTRSDNREYSYTHDKFDGQKITISLAKLENNNA